MNPLENYKAIVEKYFGAGTATFATTSGATNNLIGALNHTTEFSTFRFAFGKRMERLAGHYPQSNPNQKYLLERVNAISTNEWDGAYAELVAFDFLNSNQDYLDGPISLSKDVPASETLASSLGMINVNLDGFYEGFGVGFDVKALGDKSRGILDGIIKEAKTNLGIVSVVISPEHPLDLDYTLFQKNRKAILTELEAGINVSAQTTFVISRAVPELAFRLMWGGGVLSTISTYDPYAHAQNHHELFFTYAKQFSRNSPTLIVSVVFPWFSEQVTSNVGASEIFYRSLCRRFFCQYANDARPASSKLKKYLGSETLAEVTKKLSGVLFLEDKSITSSAAAAQNVEAFAYLNPNATHKTGGHFRDYLSSLGFAVDDFASDNY
jgi:hypothetical protein